MWAGVLARPAIQQLGSGVRHGFGRAFFQIHHRPRGDGSLTGPRRAMLGSSYNRLINDATYPAPKPLSIFTTLTFEAHEFIIPNSAANPLNAAP